MRTRELTGNALCYAVCMIEHPYLVWGETIGMHHASDQIVVPGMKEPDCYSPYLNWKMFGPIIERENICLRGVKPDFECWIPNTTYVAHGTTQLIAAMRCYVASKLGDNVNIPEELVK